MRITFVIPVHNERDTLCPLVEQIFEQVGVHDYRILFIDDGSNDGSYETLLELHERHAAVDVVRFRRNFGKSAALAAGFARADGDIVIMMDGDLQDSPTEIPKFIEKIEQGFDVVVGWKQVRHDPWHKTFPSRIYNGIVRRMFKIDLHDVNCGYKALRMEVVRNIRVYGELHRLIPVLAANLGYRVTEIPVEHQPRRYGRSKYGFERFTKGALDVLSTLFLSKYLYSPGHFMGTFGILACLVGLLSALIACAEWILSDSTLIGFAFAIMSVGLFAGGMVLVALGLVAELLVWQHPLADPTTYVSEEHRH